MINFEYKLVSIFMWGFYEKSGSHAEAARSSNG